MRANSSHVNFNEGRLREHQRQQERLKAMASTTDKVQKVSTDQLIENLLKDPFKESLQTPFPVHQVDHSNAELPLWLQCESEVVPAHYKYLWSFVNSTTDVADTEKVSQLLLTSGLQVDILGFIWNLANKKIPGQLTKQEFYIVLALVSLAQSGYSFNDSSVLKLMTVPLIPVLQVGLQKHSVCQFNVLQDLNTVNCSPNKDLISSAALQSKPFVTLNEIEKDKNYVNNSAENATALLSDFKKTLFHQNANKETDVMPNNTVFKTSELLMEQNNELCKSTNFPYIGSSPTAEPEDDFSAFQSVSTDKCEQSDSMNQSSVESKDDFTEFQSAAVGHIDPFETVVINRKTEMPKISFPKTFTGKFTNLKSTVLKISPETEKKLRVLSPSESLSSLPESKISSSNKVSTSLSILGKNHDIGSRLANHSIRLDTKLERPKYWKYHKINSNSISTMNSNAEDEIILGVKPRNLENVIPKCNPKISSNCKTFILKETKIKNDEPFQQNTSEMESSSVHLGNNTRQIEIPMLGTFNETVLPTQSKSQSLAFDLINVQEDKYSALRDIELEFHLEKTSDVKEAIVEFGDFLSADIPSNLEPEPSSALTPSSTSNLDSLIIKNIEKDDWGDWNFNLEPITCPEPFSALDSSQINTVDYFKEDPAFRTERDLCHVFTSLALNKEGSSHLLQPDSFAIEHQDYFGADIRVDNIDDVIVLNEKDKKLDDLSSESQRDQAFNTQPDNEFWEFLNTDMKSQSRDVSRQSSLRSLDLKISPTDESEQDMVWRKCLDSCHSLIQEGYDIFNSISTKCVLDEVFAASKTEEYLNNLNIVFQISKRVTQNFNCFPLIQEELEKLWIRLQDLCFEYNIKLKQDEDNCSEGKIRCKICLRHIGYNVINQGSNSYHPSCANLWINCIEPILPSFL